MTQDAPQNEPHVMQDGGGPRRLARPAVAADLTRIQSILSNAGLSVPNVSPQSDSPFESTFHVCEIDGQVVGAIHWRAIVPEAEILDLAVRTDQRRRGHASFLMRKFLRHAKAAGINKVFLEVRESNFAAFALYEKFGFAIIGRRPNYYRNPDEAALQLQLNLPG